MALDKDLRDAKNFIDAAASSVNAAADRLNSFWEESESSYAKTKEADVVRKIAGPEFLEAIKELMAAGKRLNDSIKAVYSPSAERPSPENMTGRKKAPETEKPKNEIAISPSPLPKDGRDDNWLKSLGIGDKKDDVEK